MCAGLLVAGALRRSRGRCRRPASPCRCRAGRGSGCRRAAGRRASRCEQRRCARGMAGDAACWNSGERHAVELVGLALRDSLTPAARPAAPGSGGSACPRSPAPARPRAWPAGMHHAAIGIGLGDGEEGLRAGADASRDLPSRSGRRSAAARLRVRAALTRRKATSGSMSRTKVRSGWWPLSASVSRPRISLSSTPPVSP